MKKYFLGLFLISALVLAQVNVKLQDGAQNEVIVGASGKVYRSGMITMPTTPTTLTSVTTDVQFIHCANTHASAAVTFLMTDNQASPKTYFNSVSVPVNGLLTVNYGTTGMRFASGIIWSAGTASSLNCYVSGVQ